MSSRREILDLCSQNQPVEREINCYFLASAAFIYTYVILLIAKQINRPKSNHDFVQKVKHHNSVCLQCWLCFQGSQAKSQVGFSRSCITRVQYKTKFHAAAFMPFWLSLLLLLDSVRQASMHNLVQ